MPADVPLTGKNTKPGEKPPVMPAIATTHSVGGAQAFARFFIATFDWGYATTSGTYMGHYSEPGCVSCSTFVNGLNDAHSKHRYWLGARLTLRQDSQGTSTKKFGDSELVWKVVFDQQSGAIYEANGTFINGDPPAANLTFLLYLAWHDGGWVTAEMDHLS